MQWDPTPSAPPQPLRRLNKPLILTTLASLLLVTILSTLTILNGFGASTGANTTSIGVAPTATPKWSPPASQSLDLIHQENLKAGTTAWQVDGNASDQFIQAYAGAVSAQVGDVVPLYVSSLSAARYDLAVYRLGWYQGAGGHLYDAVTGLQSQDQGYWTLSTGLANCPTCTFDSHTDLTEANWHVSYRLTIGAMWPTGVYVLKLTTTPYGVAAETYIPLVIRDDHSTANVIASLPVNTYQAYNWWGGYSLYTHIRPQATGIIPSTTDHGRAVSYDRPYARSFGSADLFAWDVQSIRWLERNNYDVTYTTNIDVAEHPELTLNHHAFVSIGHDEYWTKSMRDGLTHARDTGLSLAFFGGNAAYWQVRLAPDSAGAADRTIICYKVMTGSTDPRYALAQDPDYPAHPDEVTSQFRDPVVNEPENALLGAMFQTQDIIRESGSYSPDWVVANTNDPYLTGTGLKAGSHVAGGLVGYEYDSVTNNGATPPGLLIIAASQVNDSHVANVTHTANTTIYRAASGALVFDAGSIWWSWGLDDIALNGVDVDNKLGGSAAIQRLTQNILNAMITNTSLKA